MCVVVDDMVIHSLHEINRAIRKNIILSLVTLLTVSLFILNVSYYNNSMDIRQKNNNEIALNFDLLKYYISEKISIMASSNVFSDYLRSGAVSQQSLRSDFIFNIKAVNIKQISGMTIAKKDGEKIFSEGSVTPYFVVLPLCYFDRGLDSKLGSCSHNLTLYLNIYEVIKSLQQINNNLVSCKNCVPIDFLSDKKFGSFNIASSGSMPLSFEIKKAQSFNIFVINLFFLFVMAMLAIWNLRRTNHILQKNINDPLQKITNKLKRGEKLARSNEIDELGYLVDQIQDREEKIKRAKENEKLVSIGQMASQVAHDIRSPLAALNVIMNQVSCISDEQRHLVNHASLAISISRWRTKKFY